jgi:hypothetical protein
MNSLTDSLNHVSDSRSLNEGTWWISLRRWLDLTRGYRFRFKVKHCHQKVYMRLDANSFFAASKAPIEAYQDQTKSKRGEGIKNGEAQ